MQYLQGKICKALAATARKAFKNHLFLLACLIGAPAVAASLQVSPISFELQAREAAQGLWLNNSGAQPLQAQVRAYAWVQENGEDVLKPTQDLVVSPPMLTIPPGQRQMVRLVRVGAGLGPPASEKTYRIVMDELPVALGVESEGVKFVLRYSVPIFIAPALSASDAGKPMTTAASVQWALREGAHGPMLVAYNQGNTRAKVTAVSVTDRNGSKSVLTDGLYGYVLAGSTRHWSLSQAQAASARDGQLDMSVNDKPISVRLAPSS